MRRRQNKAARSTKGMEIVDDAPVFDRKGETAANARRTPAKEDGFTIVETVDGPAPGTFGLSDVWEKD